MAEALIAGVVLTGGRSKRMGGVIKAHILFDDKPLIQHVIDRVKPQVGRMMLSVEMLSDEFVPYGLRQIADPRPGSCGPLGGLLAALSMLDDDNGKWLFLAPCDAPFLPLNLAEKLQQRAVESGAKGCIARYQEELQPTFSIWNQSLLPELKAAVLEEGMSGFKQFLGIWPMAILDWEASDISPFFNINDPDSLSEAQLLSKQGLMRN